MLATIESAAIVGIEAHPVRVEVDVSFGLPAFTITELAAEVPTGDSLLFVEGAGGLRSPIADDGDSLALADAIHPDLVVLVAQVAPG